MMRILHGVFAGILWILFMAAVSAKGNDKIPAGMQWLTTAIIVAGAMAGGD